METDTIKEKSERWKATAEIFLKQNIQAFIKDTSDNIYLCDILFVGEDSLTVQCFAPSQRKDRKIVLYYPLITRMEEYREEA